MNSDSHSAGIVCLVIFFVIDFLFYAFGAAYHSLNESDLEDELKEGNTKAGKIREMMEKPQRFIVTTLFIHMVNVLTAGIVLIDCYSEALAGKIGSWDLPFMHHTGCLVLSDIFITLILSIVILGISVLTSKELGQKYAKAFSYKWVGLITFFMYLFLPVTFLITIFTKGILKLFKIDFQSESDNVTEEEIKSMVSEGHEQGVLEAGEAKMIANIFEFGDKEAQDIMIHRKNVVALDGEMTVRDAADMMLEANNSRFPVYYDDIDNVIGIITFKDIMIAQEDEANRDQMIKDVDGLLRKAEFIPETRNIDTLFKYMQSTKTHMVIVVDEYGQTSGIITMEDILEEIVGNIMDEYDEEEDFILSQKGNTYVVNGMIPLDEINERLGIEIEEEDYDTLNGYLISKLDRIPREDEKLEFTMDGVKYKVLKVENKMIALVRITVTEREMSSPKESIEKEKEN